MRVGRKTGGENHGIDTHQVRVEYPTCLATDVVIPVGAVSIGLAIANPMPMPMMDQEWAVTSIASNSAHTTTDDRHVNQPWYRRP